MYWETLPDWMWSIFYALLLLTLGLAIISIKQSKDKGLSIVAIIFILTAPVIGMINTIEREYGINEFEHLVAHLQQGSLWAIYMIISCLYILVWWILFFFRNQAVKRSG